MAEIQVLIQGQVKKILGGEYASSSVTLIRDRGLNILVDTGLNRELLINSLKKAGLAPADINYVIITHTHLDHCLLAGIFEKAKVLDDSSSYTFDGLMADHGKKIPGTEIEIIAAPGHDQFHCVVLVKTKAYGRVVIAGDLFWWPDDKEQLTDKDSLINLGDKYLVNQEASRLSREKILKIADFIVPGHGRPFKINRI